MKSQSLKKNSKKLEKLVIIVKTAQISKTAKMSNYCKNCEMLQKGAKVTKKLQKCKDQQKS